MPRKRDLREEIDELFADLWQVSRLGGLRRGFRPQLDCFVTKDPPAFTVIVDIAGVDPERVSVSTAEGALVISGERGRADCSGGTYQQMEIEYGSFQRVVQLPRNADASQAEAADTGSGTSGSQAAGSEQAAPSGDTVEIEMWHGYGELAAPGEEPNYEYDWLKSAVDAFEASHPGIKVKLTYVNSDVALEKLTVALQGGKAPDVTYQYGTPSSRPPTRPST